MPVKQLKGVKEIIDIGSEREEIDEKEQKKGETHTIAGDERYCNFFNGPGELKSNFLETTQGTDPPAEDLVSYYREEDHSCCHNNHWWRYKAIYLINGKGFSEGAERAWMYAEKNTKDGKKDDQGNNPEKV